MGILVKCAALNLVTILLAALAMLTAIVALAPPRWLTFKVQLILSILKESNQEI